MTQLYGVEEVPSLTKVDSQVEVKREGIDECDGEENG